jgi:hypothetical protein
MEAESGGGTGMKRQGTTFDLIFNSAGRTSFAHSLFLLSGSCYHFIPCHSLFPI